MKKYELTDEFIENSFGVKLYRIKALVAIASIGISVGDLGGFIEKEDCLSHGGNAWVYGDARVSGDAQVSGNARVYGDAQVYGNAWVDNRRSIVWFTNVGTENGTLTACKNKNGDLLIIRGCFFGTDMEFLEKSKAVHDGKTAHEYRLLIEVAKSRVLNYRDSED